MDIIRTILNIMIYNNNNNKLKTLNKYFILQE